MPKMNLDVLDLKILRTLQAEGRLTNVELADRIGLSPSPCLRRVKRLEAEGIIEGYGARINRVKVGVGVTVFVAVGLERHREEEAERFRKVVQRLRQVISCHAISGESDFLLEIVVADLHEYSESVLKRLPRIPGVKDLHSSFALEAMKTGTVLPLPEKMAPGHRNLTRIGRSVVREFPCLAKSKRPGHPSRRGFSLMSFYRKNWYYVGGVLFVAVAFLVGFWGNEIDPIRKILLLSFMALLMHQFEEYAIPGGFPAVFNIGWHHETEAPDRYPLNRLTCVCVNTFLAYPFYILPIVFPRIVWLGLAQILFGMVGQLFVHGIVINRKLHAYYNPGLAVTVFLHVPIGAYYIWYVYAHGLIEPWHWIVGIAACGLAMLLVVGLPVRLLRDRNSPYPFDPDEMARFRVREKPKKLAAK